MVDSLDKATMINWMLIQVARVPEDGQRLSGEEPAEILDLLPEGGFHVSGPVRADLFVHVVSGELLVRGTVEVQVGVQCARCLEFFSTTVRDSAFLRAYPGIHGTEEVDITEDLREAILLNLPLFPVCNDACRGLCAGCGNKLSEGPCGCPGPPETGLAGLLEGLDLKKEQE